MKTSKILIATILLLIPFFVLSGEEIMPGDWYQTSSTAGDAPDIVMSIVKVTPHIIQLDSNNGWVGFAWYDEEEDEYRGFFELLKDTGDPMEGWTNKVFRIRMVMDYKTLHLEGVTNREEHFIATFRMKKEI